LGVEKTKEELMRSLSVICLLLLPVTALAQRNFGTMSGSVSDTNHGPVGGTSVQAKNTETGMVYKTASDLRGNYTLSELPPGTYDVSATSFGFKAFERKNVVIAADQTFRLDIPIGDFISLDTLGEDRAGLGKLFLSRPKPPEGPAPRTSDGKPDFSGLWFGPLPLGPSSGEPLELLPWAAAVAKERSDNNLKDNPSARCLPFNLGPMNMFLNRLVQTHDLLVTIIEYDIPGYRQAYLDGREHPKNLESSWTGHSVGKWDGDTLVIETVGFNDKTWLGESGPHTDKLRVTSRFRRPDLGHIEIETTFDDLGALKKPWKTKGIATLAPATEEIPEFICNENNQDVEHLVGK
jgi:Carboxypeptidase regulatory-like domain